MYTCAHDVYSCYFTKLSSLFILPTTLFTYLELTSLLCLYTLSLENLCAFEVFIYSTLATSRTILKCAVRLIQPRFFPEVLHIKRKRDLRVLKTAEETNE